ncbi:hypothetical protein C0Z20_22850 [Trinickia symbiotica]|uniref:Uncharacterized protein n=1 Tax=Trinickia symbiotica TaxID=863227 RepID=A0A2N7WYQ3_9BURK|nr:hypothetical protein C0Z20_22850 [Trinickia symbiotica]
MPPSDASGTRIELPQRTITERAEHARSAARAPLVRKSNEGRSRPSLPPFARDRNGHPRQAACNAGFGFHLTDTRAAKSNNRWPGSPVRRTMAWPLRFDAAALHCKKTKCAFHLRSPDVRMS